jgi:hypothetical protein
VDSDSRLSTRAGQIRSPPAQRHKRKRAGFRQPFEFYGAVEVNRTLDLLITNQLLYQLSYNGTLSTFNQSGHQRCFSRVAVSRA